MSEPKSRRQPEQQAPPVQRLRLRYAKRGPARFTSHRDFGRAFERALRRAGVPMAYSSGFNPHPRISYANASPTGAATEAEYLEIGLAEVCDPQRVMAAMNEVLPPGLVLLEVVESTKGALADQLTASSWRVDLGDVDATLLASAVQRLMDAEEFQVSRMTKSGVREFDVRGAIVSLSVDADGQLLFTGRHETPLVRPDDVVNALREIEPGLAGLPPLLLRLEQGMLGESGELVAP